MNIIIITVILNRVDSFYYHYSFFPLRFFPDDGRSLLFINARNFDGVNILLVDGDLRIEEDGFINFIISLPFKRNLRFDEDDFVRLIVFIFFFFLSNLILLFRLLIPRLLFLDRDADALRGRSFRRLLSFNLL